MKKQMLGCATFVTLALALVAGLLLSGVEPSTAAEQVIKLKFQGKWEGHEKSNWAAEQLKFSDRVKAATNGRILIENTDEIVRDNEVLDGVRKGLLDIGAQGAHSRGELGLVNFISLPFISFDKVPELYGKLKPTFAGYWDKLGVQQLGYIYFLPQGLFTKKPCTTLEDIRGMKLRINGNILVQLFKLAGGNPITMNNADVYQAGQRGILDGAQVAYAGYFSNAWYEVFKYMSDWPMGALAMGVVMNKDSWNKLGPTLQGQLMSAWSETEKAQIAGVYKDLAGIEQQVASKGAIRMNPSQAEKDKLGSFAGQVVQDWKTKVGPESGAVLKVVNETMGTKY
jgi:TRAP-type C4-dicarboxylate transport system substrate-binding protein